MEGAEDESSPILSFLLPDEFDVCENDMVPGFMAGDIRVNENPGNILSCNMYVTSKNESSNSPIHEFKVLQNVFKINKQDLECFLK